MLATESPFRQPAPRVSYTETRSPEIEGRLRRLPAQTGRRIKREAVEKRRREVKGWRMIFFFHSFALVTVPATHNGPFTRLTCKFGSNTEFLALFCYQKRIFPSSNINEEYRSGGRRETEREGREQAPRFVRINEKQVEKQKSPRN